MHFEFSIKKRLIRVFSCQAELVEVKGKNIGHKILDFEILVFDTIFPVFDFKNRSNWQISIKMNKGLINLLLQSSIK